MATVTFKDTTGNNFTRSAGCLCILGKNEEYCRNLKAAADSRFPADFEFDTLSFDKIGRDQFKVPHEKHRETVEKLLSLFPFMACLESSIDDLLKGKAPVFNIKDYSRNVVMHAMFHYRTMFSGYGTSRALKFKTDALGLYGLVFAIEHLTTEYKLPFWKAYILSVMPNMPIAHDMALQIEYCTHQYSADANLYFYASTPVSTMLHMLTGSYDPDHFNGMTFQQAVSGQNVNNNSYSQNISSYLNHRPAEVLMDTKTGKVSYHWMSAFYQKVGMRVKSSAKEIAVVKDIFGNEIVSGQSKETPEMWISALDHSLENYCVHSKLPEGLIQ